MFLSHINSIKPGSFLVLAQYNNKKIIANSNDQYKIISNICPHQNSLISTSAGRGSRVCPYHTWSFTLEGTPITSGRTEYYCKNEISLDSKEAFEWNGLIFDTPIFFETDVDFKDLILIESRVDIVKANYKIIMDLFLDVDHIQSIHAGVYDLVDITNTEVEWKYYNNGSIQEVHQGARWIALYPYTMIEWQQGSLFITVAVPNGESSKVHIFKYADTKFMNKWKLNEFVWETAWKQDVAQAEIITEFVDKNLEPQKQHFRNFLNLRKI